MKVKSTPSLEFDNCLPSKNNQVEQGLCQHPENALLANLEEDYVTRISES